MKSFYRCVVTLKHEPGAWEADAADEIVVCHFGVRAKNSTDALAQVKKAAPGLIDPDLGLADCLDLSATEKGSGPGDSDHGPADREASEAGLVRAALGIPADTSTEIMLATLRNKDDQIRRVIATAKRRGERLKAVELSAAMACENPCGDCAGCHLAEELLGATEDRATSEGNGQDSDDAEERGEGQ